MAVTLNSQGSRDVFRGGNNMRTTAHLTVLRNFVGNFVVLTNKFFIVSEEINPGGIIVNQAYSYLVMKT